MAKIQIFLDEVLQKEVALKPGVNTVGRDPGNTIQIDDPGVSGCHIKIIQNKEAPYVEDNGSKNGTFLNGQSITRHRLKHGDKVAIWKYSLKYLDVGKNTATAEDSPAQSAPETPSAAQTTPIEEIDAGSTVALDLSQLKGVLQQHREDAYLRSASQTSEKGNSTARLVTVNEGRGMKQQTHSLNKASLFIGRKASCDIKVGGWFAPAIAAEVSQEDNNYVVKPRKRGKVALNGDMINATMQLNDGDRLSVRNIEMKFYS